MSFRRVETSTSRLQANYCIKLLLLIWLVQSVLGCPQESTGYGNKQGPKAYKQMPVDPVAKLLQMTCARCHKLTHMGRVQSEAAEKELPPFDLAAALASQVKSNWSRRSVVLLVVDVADFDGSLPRCARTNEMHVCALDWPMLKKERSWAHASATAGIIPVNCGHMWLVLAGMPFAASYRILSSDWQPGDVLPFELVLAVNKMGPLPRVVSDRRIEKPPRHGMKAKESRLGLEQA
jgi:hypothetical protein